MRVPKKRSMTPLVCGDRTRGADMAQQGVVAGEGGLVDLAAEARPVVGDDGDRGGNDVDDPAGVLVDQFERAAVGAQVVEAEHAFGLDHRRMQGSQRVCTARSRGDLGG